MESQGLPGRIQLTETTKERLEHGFDFEDRGAVEIKGKGSTGTYFLLGETRGH